MVKTSDLEKDIRTIADKVGSAVFTYDEVHNPDVDNKFKYDYQKVIDEISRIHGQDMTEALLKNGILSILPDGEYKVNVGKTTEKGGGINYWGMAFFSRSKGDFQVHYHELAHSLQGHYDLFNNKTLDEIYEKSGKGLDDEEKEKKLADRSTFGHYLKEMHSESFSNAALMLRAENWGDFAKEAFKAYYGSVLRNLSGLFDPKKTYNTGDPASKYYSTYPVIKETIKQVYHIRRQNKLGDFFDEKGVLNDEKLARLSETIVKEKGYSPRTLKSYFNYNILDGHKYFEHGWKRDTIKSLALFIPVSTLALVDIGINASKKITKTIDHKKMVKEEKKILNNYIKTPISKDKSLEEQALEAYQKILLKMPMIDKEHEGAYIGVRLKRDLENAYHNGGFPDYYVNDFKRATSMFIGVNGKRVSKGVDEAAKYINTILKECGKNPFLETLIKTDVSPNVLQKMIAEKKKDKTKQVVALNLDESSKDGFRNHPVQNMLNQISLFCHSHGIRKNIEYGMFEKLVKTPEKFKDEKFRKELLDQIKVKNDFLGIKNRKLKKEFNVMMDSVASTYFTIRGNDKFEKALSFLNNTPPSEMESVVSQRVIQEREGIDVIAELEKSAKANNFRKKVQEAEENVDFMRGNILLHAVANNEAYTLETKDKFLNLMMETANKMKDCSEDLNYYQRNEYFGSLLAEKLKESDTFSKDDKDSICNDCYANVNHKGFKEAFLSTYTYGEDKPEVKVETIEKKQDDVKADVVSTEKEEKEIKVEVLKEKLKDKDKAEIKAKKNESIPSSNESPLVKESYENKKPSEEVLVDDMIKNQKFSRETLSEVLNIAVELEQKRLNGEDMNGKTYSEVFMDKVIVNEKISEADKNKILNMAIKTENNEIEQTEGGKRIYFDESKKERFEQLKLRDELKDALDIKLEDGKLSIKIPEDNNLKSELLRTIRAQEGIENIKSTKKDNNVVENKSNTNNSLTINMAKFMANNKSK